MDIFQLTSFSATFTWVIAHGYFLMFIAMLIEGPIVTAAASFALAFGYFNFGAIFILSILGDIVADVIYYAIGYFSRITVVEKWDRHFKLTTERIKRIEHLVNKHPIKTLIALKLTPILPTPGLMIVGATRMNLRKFVSTCAVIILPKVIFFMAVGYYFGAAYGVVIKRFERGGLMLILMVILGAGIYYGFNKFSAYIAKKVEKI